jgi:hypothetical protein
VVGVLEEVELGGLATGLPQEEVGVTTLLRAVSEDMQKEVPERRAIPATQVNDRQHVPVIQPVHPASHLLFIARPMLGHIGEGWIVLRAQRRVPHFLRLASEPAPPTPLHIEREQQGVLEISPRKAGRFGEFGLG